MQIRAKIIERLQKIKAPIKLEFPVNCKNASVLLILSMDYDKILFTQRSMKLSKHGGEISFPGGLWEPNETALEAALRETEEEIGLKSVNIDVLGSLFPVPNRFGAIKVHPFVGVSKIPFPSSFHLSEEVDRVFVLSISELCDESRIKRESFRNSSILIPSFEIDENARLWGLTSFITYFFIENIIKPLQIV